MVIVGITGAIGHGKSTLAEALVQHDPSATHLESYYLVAEVADALHSKLDSIPAAGDYKALNSWLKALPAILKHVTHLDVSFDRLEVRAEDIAKDPLTYQKLFQHLDALKANPALSKAKITDDNKSDYRAILQWLGGYLVAKASPSIWWDEMIRRARAAIKKGSELAIMGGVRYPSDVEVIRAAGGKIVLIERPGASEPDSQDPTERERSQIKPDATVVNNGSLEDLTKCTARLLTDLQRNKLQKKYLAI